MRSLRTPSSGRRRCRAATTRRVRSWRCASSVIDEALAAALRIDSPDWAIGPRHLAAAAALGGRADLAARAGARVMELEPTIAKSLPEVLRRWRVEPVMAGRSSADSRPRRL